MHRLWLVLNDVKIRLLRAEDIADILPDDQVLLPVDTLRNLFLLFLKLGLNFKIQVNLARIAVLFLFGSFMLCKACLIEEGEDFAELNELLQPDFHLLQEHELLIRALLTRPDLGFGHELVDGGVNLLDLLRLGAPLMQLVIKGYLLLALGAAGASTLPKCRLCGGLVLLIHRAPQPGSLALRLGYATSAECTGSSGALSTFCDACSAAACIIRCQHTLIVSQAARLRVSLFFFPLDVVIELLNFRLLGSDLL